VLLVPVTVTPRPTDTQDDRDLARRVADLEALIEEARRRARRRRLRNGGAGALIAAAGVAALIGFGGRSGGAAGTAAHARTLRNRAGTAAASTVGGVLVTMRGYVIAARTLNSAGGPVHYRIAGRFSVAWRVPAPDLTQRGRTLRSTSASVTGTTSAVFDNAPARSCRGTLTVRRRPFLLRIEHGAYDAYLAAAPIGFEASPSPIATATSASCARGMFAGRWRLTVPQSKRASAYLILDRRRVQDWWVYNHPGGAFYGPSFTPVPKGGASEGWIAGWGPAGSFRWLAVFRVHRVPAATQRPSYRRVLRTDYTPIPGLFLNAVEPCTNNRFAACRRDDTAVRRAVETLTTALNRTPVPSELARGDRELRRGLAALDTALRLRIRLAHQSTIEPFIRADFEKIVPALNLMDVAARDLDKADPRLHLQPV
jgi:hypothetical protein